MSRHLRLGEFLVAVEGVAMMRQLFEGDDRAAAARVEEIRGIVCDGGDLYDQGVDVPVLDPRSGYARWSQTYDQPGNALISVEQPAVWSILDRLSPGDALDAACGTGRHAKHLVDLGHRVVGVDSSPEMLEKARAAVPQAEFRPSELTSRAVESASVEVAVCALALEHVLDLELAIAELARVVRPGGTIVLSDLHPTPRVLGGAAYFQDARGGAGVVRGHRHLHGDYVRAFEKARLAVRRCLEPPFGPAEVTMQGPASTFIPDATAAAYLDMPAALVWQVERQGSGTTPRHA